MDIVWDGTTQNATLSESRRKARHDLADAAQRFDWSRVLELISSEPELVNTVRPEGKSGFTPLHQAAFGDAPAEVIRQLIAMNAARTIQNAKGERPVDVAEERGHRHLLDALTPQIRHAVPYGILQKIETNFHSVISGRAQTLIEEHRLRLPQLELLLELDQPLMWFPIPGMYGGFSYRLEAAGVRAKLISKSWCRVEDGSGQRHEITSAGGTLVDEGFV